MERSTAAGWRLTLKATGRVFSVFLALGRKSRRSKIFFSLSFLPVAVALVIKFNQLFSSHEHLEEGFAFTNIIMLFYLQLIILIVALFYGTSVCSEDVEGKTLAYLITRPVPKAAIVLGKYGAYTLLNIGMVALGLIFSFIALHFDKLGDVSLGLLLRFFSVLTLGLIAYTAFFTFLGGLLRRAIFFGLLFSFGWENVIQYFPGSTQRFAIVHYLKSFLPAYPGGRFSFLTFRLEATPPGTALLILALITAGFLALACLVFSNKEYNIED
jgi:ABC-2 type transport system permease protein